MTSERTEWEKHVPAYDAEAHKGRIGASEAAALLFAHPYISEKMLRARLDGKARLPTPYQQSLFEFGRTNEWRVLQYAEGLLGVPLQPGEALVGENIVATPDAWTADRHALVEAKCRYRAEASPVGIPSLAYYVQVNLQLEMSGADEARLVVATRNNGTACWAILPDPYLAERIDAAAARFLAGKPRSVADKRELRLIATKSMQANMTGPEERPDCLGLSDPSMFPCD